MNLTYFRLLLIFICFTIVACSKNLSYTFELSKNDIQNKLTEKFPLKPPKEGDSPLELTISGPVVILEESKNQIGLKVDILAELAAPAEKLPALPSNTSKLSSPEVSKSSVKGFILPSNDKKLPSPPVSKPNLKNLPPPSDAPKPHFTGTATIFVSISYDPKTKAINLSNPKITNLEVAQLPEPTYEPLTKMAEKALSEKLSQQSIPLENKTTLDKTVTTFLKSVNVKNGKVLVEIGW